MHHYPHPTIAVFFLFFVSKSLSLLVIFTSYKSELFHIKPFYFLSFLQLLSSTASLYSWQYMFLEISYKFNEILGDTVVVSIVASHHQKSIVDWLVFPHCPLCGIRCVCHMQGVSHIVAWALFRPMHRNPTRNKLYGKIKE